MNSIGNLLWLLLGGIVVAIIYWIVGLLMCITIIGIPFGIQLIKLGSYALGPSGMNWWTVPASRAACPSS